jgi:pyruvate-formate lyase
VQIVLRGVMDYAAHLSQEAAARTKKETDPKRKAQWQEMSQVCAQIPVRPARNFYEAVNCVWICIIAIHAESCNMAISPGRLDQVLYPYYKKDIAADKLTIERAMELTGSLWLKLGDNVDLVPQVSEELFGGAGTAPAVTVGGINENGADENGVDAVNDLTYIILRVTELLKTREPNLNARYHYITNTKEYRDRVCEVITSTKAVPAFHNDVQNISTLRNQGVTLQHAIDYAIIGCVELAVTGRSYDASSSIIMNLVGPLEMALYNGKRYMTGDEDFGAPQTGDPTTFKTYDEFWEAYKAQATYVIEKAIELNEMTGKIHQQMLPTPLLSTFYEGPMETGKDLIFGGAIYNSSGATHVGFADTADSLNAIRKAVFEDIYCTFKELLDAVRSNFAKNEPLRQYLINKTPKYGTDEEVKAKTSSNLVEFLYNLYHGHINYRGGRYRTAFWTMTNHAGQGKITYALPNGRLSAQPFASGITSVSGATSNLTECLNSVASLGSNNIPGGEALNIKFTQIQNETDVTRMGDFITAYFKQGGQQVQFNIMSYAMLEDAPANPQKYPDLLVRVSGYSAYFNDLNDTMKDELIHRTEYDITNGKPVPFK